MRGAMRTAAVMVVMAGTAGVAAAQSESSLRYSALVDAEDGALLHGWQANVATDPSRRLQWVLDAGGHYAGGGSLHTLMAGPRLSTRPSSGGTRLFAQVLAGGGLVGFDEGAGMLLVATPGLGVDLGTGKRLSLRVQADWPLITNYGVIAVAPRLSAGVVLRPGRP